MARMVVVYKTPKDADAFNRHYVDIHIPLAKKLPGLRSYEVSLGSISMMGSASDTYLVGILHFDNLADIRSAFESPEGQACAADRRKFCADGDVQMFLFDSKVV